eukprot:gene4693-3363_t
MVFFVQEERRTLLDCVVTVVGCDSDCRDPREVYCCCHCRAGDVRWRLRCFPRRNRNTDDDGPPLRYLRLHLTSRSTSLAAAASATQLRSDLAAWLVVRHVWDEATTTWLWRWLTTPPSLAAALAPAAASPAASSVSPAAVAWGCGAQLTSLTLWSCRVLCAAHVQRFVVRGPWQRLRRLSLEMIGDLDAPTDEDEAEDEAAEEAAYVSPVEELELNNCAELTVAGLRAFLFTATAATTGTADAAAEDAAAEAEEAVRWTLRRCWRRLRLVRLTAASLRPSPFGATAAAGAAAATATATVKQQLQALARDCDAVGIRLHDGYRFVSPAASASAASAASAAAV